MDEKLRIIAKTFGEEKFKFDEDLKYHTALKKGGFAGLFFVSFSQKELIKLVTVCNELYVPYVVIGTGSKAIFLDKDFNGLVIKNRTRDINTISVKGKVTRAGIGVEEAVLEVDSGVSIDKLVEYLDKEKLSSEEFKDIPGTIGGNIFVSEILQNRAKSIKVLDLNLEVEQIQPSELSLRNHIVLSVILKIKARL